MRQETKLFGPWEENPCGIYPEQIKTMELRDPVRLYMRVGTTRMGNNPESSVLNKYSQAHESRNVFVADAGPFVSQPHKNPTWTILAMSMRTSEYIASEVLKRNLGTA